MRIKLLSILLLYSLTTISQNRNEIGVIGGVSYYMGDYNLNTQFYQPSPAFGFLFKHNFTSLFGLRLSAMAGGLKGSHSNEKYFLPGATPSFSNQIIEADIAAEFGFLPFSTRQSHHKNLSPYVIVGAGAAYINGSIIPHIPMGIGFKYSPIERMSIGFEWRIHKTFYDSIDGYVNVSDKPRSFIHNNDWFGIAGIIVTYRLINKGAICPAYE
jgi:hypothetical protein